jgi:hypothetical protein
MAVVASYMLQWPRLPNFPVSTLGTTLPRRQLLQAPTSYARPILSHSRAPISRCDAFRRPHSPPAPADDVSAGRLVAGP